MTSKIVELERIGKILLERSRRARRINISVRSLAGVRVAVPSGVSFVQAEAFARSKVQWIRRHLDKMAQAAKDAGTLGLKHPIDRAAARQLLVRRLDQLAAQHGFQYHRVFVRNQKTRWGSCSARDNINLNVNLVRLPDALRDYVILHELVHTRVRNHGEKFWQEMEQLMPGARDLDRELNRYRLLPV